MGKVSCTVRRIFPPKGWPSPPLHENCLTYKNWQKVCLFDGRKILPTSAEKDIFALCKVRNGQKGRFFG